MNPLLSRALLLYGILALGLLILSGWLIFRILAAGNVQVDMVAFLTVIFMAFRDVISKMGETVRAIIGAPLPAEQPDHP